MPIQLPNGLVIYNATPHDLWFGYLGEPICCPSDGVINAQPTFEVAKRHPLYQYKTARFLPTPDGWEIIQTIDKKEKELGREYVIVGSVLAAQAYPGWVVAPKPLSNYRWSGVGNGRVNKSNDFTVFVSNQERKD